VELVFLPAYSPELNPCELVFGEVKGVIRNNSFGYNLVDEIITQFSNVPHAHILNYYRKCIFPRELLPDFHPEKNLTNQYF
jgi:transposase